MSPWILLLFAAIFNFGFYAYALISAENAARVGALTASQTWGAASDGTTVCLQVLEEMRYLPNVGPTTTCNCSGVSCTAGPMQITLQPISGTTCLEGVAAARCARVTLSYQTVPLFPLPYLTGQLTIVRVAEAKVGES